jgi:hypothetical protein
MSSASTIGVLEHGDRSFKGDAMSQKHSDALFAVASAVENADFDNLERVVDNYLAVRNDEAKGPPKKE